jgi:transitional endoplasmic reticulum ATPase
MLTCPHDWEVSFTNEFLTQMERFRGLLICTTNRVTDLDDASLRRFSRKVEFRPLTGYGALMLYRRLLAPLVGSRPTSRQQEDVERIPGLTPGIFRLAHDEMVLSGRTPTHGGLIAALRREIGLLKEIRGRRIGFGS